MRFSIDGSWERFNRVVIAGSPLRLFRLTPRGAAVISEIESGNDVTDTALVTRLIDAGAIHPRPTGSGHQFATDDVTVVTPQLGGITNRDGRITVDDGSRPPLPGATLRLVPNRGPAAARNAARPLIETALVAFMDSDVMIENDDWLAPLLAHFDDPRVGLAAPRVRGERGSPLDMGSEPARIRAGTRVSYVPAAAMVVRVSALDSVGGFDEGLRFGEDVDLVWRLDEAGWHCRYEPLSAVWHRPRSNWIARLRQHADYGTSAAPLALRHPRALAPARMNAWTAAAWTVLFAGHPIVALTTAVGSAAALVPRLPGVPHRQAMALALRGHLLAGRQLAAAARRTWWPIVVVGGLISRRLRWVACGAVLLDVRATPTDVAYGWGVWVGMRRHRTARPLVPSIGTWPR